MISYAKRGGGSKNPCGLKATCNCSQTNTGLVVLEQCQEGPQVDALVSAIDAENVSIAKMIAYLYP